MVDGQQAGLLHSMCGGGLQEHGWDREQLAAGTAGSRYNSPATSSQIHACNSHDLKFAERARDAPRRQSTEQRFTSGQLILALRNRTAYFRGLWYRLSRTIGKAKATHQSPRAPYLLLSERKKTETSFLVDPSEFFRCRLSRRNYLLIVPAP